MQKPITLSNLKDSQAVSFQEFMNKLAVLETSLEALIDEEKARIKTLEEKTTAFRQEEEIQKSIRIEIDRKNDELSSLIRENKNKKIAMDDLETSLKKKEESLTRRADAMNQDEQNLTLKSQGIKKRETFLDMEERRLQFLDKKLNLIAQDKQISEKLKELE